MEKLEKLYGKLIKGLENEIASQTKVIEEQKMIIKSYEKWQASLKQE